MLAQVVWLTVVIIVGFSFTVSELQKIRKVLEKKEQKEKK